MFFFAPPHDFFSQPSIFVQYRECIWEWSTTKIFANTFSLNELYNLLPFHVMSWHMIFFIKNWFYFSAKKIDHHLFRGPICQSTVFSSLLKWILMKIKLWFFIEMNSHENWVMIFHWNQDWLKLTRDFRMLLTQACSTRKYVSSRELTNSAPSYYIVEQRNTLRKDRERVSACSCCCGLQWLPFHYVRLIFIILNNKNKKLNCDQNASELFCPGIIASTFNCERVTTSTTVKWYKMGLLPLEFSDCLLDSPYFRENLRAHEKQLEQTATDIKGIISNIQVKQQNNNLKLITFSHWLSLTCASVYSFSTFQISF